MRNATISHAPRAGQAYEEPWAHKLRALTLDLTHNRNLVMHALIISLTVAGAVAAVVS
jgi:hypothetical protein